MAVRINNSIYTPVIFEDGTRRVQVCTETFDRFCGWADGCGKYDYSGTWEVCDKWEPEQSAQFAKAVASAKNNFGESCVKIRTHEDGISRVITVIY